MLLGASSYVIKRKQGGEYVNGLWVEGTTQSIVIVASIQPFSGRDLLIMPEGLASRKPVKVFTKTYLETADVSKQPDQIIYRNEVYTIVRTQFYNDFAPIPHNCYIAYTSEVE